MTGITIMKERPILFSAPMVRAIISGQKTQTRRLLTTFPDDDHGADPSPVIYRDGTAYVRNKHGVEIWLCHCKYGKPGDRLWVRETFAIEHQVAYDQLPPFNDGRPIAFRGEFGTEWRQCHYRATDPTPELAYEDGSGEPACRWQPSIHMPRWASRITLEIVSVRVERLNEISETDALDEGITYNDIPNNGLDPRRARTWFRGLWESINGAGSWAKNPWVWVIEFRRLP